MPSGKFPCKDRLFPLSLTPKEAAKHAIEPEFLSHALSQGIRLRIGQMNKTEQVGVIREIGRYEINIEENNAIVTVPKKDISYLSTPIPLITTFAADGPAAGFEDEIRKAAQYPASDKTERIKRFYAQFEAWHWYCGEALRLNNPYLLGTSVSKFILFCGRLILAHNESLYPYHKWFLKVLEQVEEKPAGLMETIHALNGSPTAENIEALYGTVRDFRPWIEGDISWPTQFMLDSELNWQDGKTPVDDL